MAFTPIVSTAITSEVVTGNQQIINGGIATSNSIRTSGNQVILSGGTAIANTCSGSQTVSSAGTASNTKIYGGVQYVSSGGVAVAATIKSGGQYISSGNTFNYIGSQCVSFGGIAVSTTVNAGGRQYISSGGVASSTIINSGGSQYVFSGGVAISTMIDSYGWQYVSYGGVAISTTIKAGCRQYISSEGIASSTTINSGGRLYLSSGGVANTINQNSRGAILTNTGATISGGVNARGDGYGYSKFSIVNGIARNFLLENYGELTVLSGHSAINTVVSLDCRLYVSSGGIANIATINGGNQVVSSMGVANSTTIQINGSQSILSGAVANYTSINSGYQFISSGGTANFTTIDYCGSQNISFGGTANSTIINFSGTQVISSGGTANYIDINSKGMQTISSGGVANYTSISTGGWQIISSGGVANSTELNTSGAWQTVFSGGIANSTTINSSSTQVIYSGGTANYTVINSKGKQAIASGVIANSTTINYGGIQTIGGIANSTTINSGGVLAVVSGGSANMIKQQSGAAIRAYAGAIITRGTNTRTDGHSAFSIISGIASNFLLENDGQLTVLSGNSAIDTVIAYGGSQIVSSGGSTIGFTITSGGNQIVSSGGSAIGFTITSGGIIQWDFNTVISGTSNGVAVTNSGGNTSYNLYLSYTRQDVSSGYTANSATIDLAGTQYIYSGGVANSTTINNYFGSQYVHGVANSTTINLGGCQNVTSGGLANFTTISSGGSQHVDGVANSTTINGEGSMRVYSGGTVNMINQQSGAAIIADTGAKITGGTNIRTDGHSAFFIISGIASNFLLENGGQLTVLAGNSAIDTVIAYGGSQIVSSGGTTNSTTIDYGGRMYVSSGGIIVDTLVMAGGFVVLEDAASVGDLTTLSYVLAKSITTYCALVTVNGGTLGTGATTYSLNLDNTTVGSYILVDGVDLSGLSGKTFSATDNSQTINLTVGSSYTFSNGDTLSLKLTDSTRDQLTATFTEIVPPSLPTGLVRAITGNNAVFDWDDSTDASGIKLYEIKVDNNIDFSSSQYSVSPVASTITINNLDDGIYYWKVRTLDNCDNYSAWTTGSSFMIDITAPTAPSSLTTQIIVGNNVVFDWADATDATSGVKNYLFQYATNAMFTGATQITVTASNANVSKLADGTYYWRVQTTDNFGNASAWTTGSSFMIDLTGPSIPASLTQTVTGNNVAFDWTDATDATSGVKQYEYQVDNNADFSSNEKSGTSVASNASVTTLADGNYFWRVRTQDKSGNYSSWTTGCNFIVDITAPSVLGGLTETVTGNNVTFDWADTTDATSGVKNYLFQYATNALFTGATQSTVTVSNANVSKLADGTYYWRVQPTDNSGNASAWTSGGSFMVDLTAPSVPASLTQTVTGNNVTFDWADATDAISSVKQYEFQVDNNSNFSSNEKSGTATVSNANVTSLAAGTYYWRVRAQDNSSNWSSWSNAAFFVIPIADAGNTFATASDIATLDNRLGIGDPADYYKLTMTGAGMLTLGLTGLSGDINLSLLDAKGKVLKTSANRGTANESITNYLFLSGTYYVNIVPARGVNSATYTLTHAETYFPDDKAANTWQTAKDISTIDNWVGYGDPADYYKLIMTNAGTLTLGLTSLNGDSNLSLLDSKGTVLKTSSNRLNTAEAITANLLAGNYYVKVAPVTGVNSATYTLTHAEKYCPADKAKDTWQTANDIATIDNWVGFGDPADCYKLMMTNAGTLTLGLTGLSGDSNLALLDSKGKVLKTSANKGIAAEAITDFALLAGTYYVNVAPATSVNSATYTLTHAEKYCPADKAKDTWQTANDIATLDNWVGFGDAADCYKLIMTNAGTLTLGLSGLSGDANLLLLDAKGKVLKTSANRWLTGEAISMDLLAGTYYVNVAPVTGVNSVAYTLTHAEKYCPVDKAQNTWQTAKDVSNLDNWVGFGDPADCYKRAMSKNGTLTLNLTGLTGDANVSLLDSKGMVLKTSANKLNASEAITADLVAGTYYVNVAPVAGVNKADYTLAHAENYFPNDTALNTFALAKQVMASGSVNEWLGFGDKDDYYKFELKTSTTVALNLTGITSDVNLYLYDSKNRPLAASAKPGNTAESISKALLAGTYYIKATLAGKANTGYALNFNIDPAAFKSGSLQLFGSSSPLSGSDASLGSNDPLKKNQGMLAS